MTPEPPVPVLAHFRPLSPVLDVTFDKPLRPGALAATNWFGRRNDTLWNVLVPPNAAGSVVTMTTNPIGPHYGPDIVNYGATPADVVTATFFVPAAGFTQFPIT